MSSVLAVAIKSSKYAKGKKNKGQKHYNLDPMDSLEMIEK